MKKTIFALCYLAILAVANAQEKGATIGLIPQLHFYDYFNKVEVVEGEKHYTYQPGFFPQISLGRYKTNKKGDIRQYYSSFGFWGKDNSYQMNDVASGFSTRDLVNIMKFNAQIGTTKYKRFYRNKTNKLSLYYGITHAIDYRFKSIRPTTSIAFPIKTQHLGYELRIEPMLSYKIDESLYFDVSIHRLIGANLAVFYGQEMNPILPISHQRYLYIDADFRQLPYMRSIGLQLQVRFMLDNN